MAFRYCSHFFLDRYIISYALDGMGEQTGTVLLCSVLGTHRDGHFVFEHTGTIHVYPCVDPEHKRTVPVCSTD